MGYTSPNYISLNIAPTSFNTLASTTYYFDSRTTAMGTTEANYKIWIPKTGIITDVMVHSRQVAGTNEATSIYIRKNNTTDYTLSTALDFSSTSVDLKLHDLNFPVTVDDYINIKLVTPAWVSAPTGVIIGITIHISIP